MKTLAASIVGIFAIGLALGSLVSGSGAVPALEEPELQAALDSAPLVDCGEGREALLEPVERDGETSFKVRCVPTETERAPERTTVVSRSEAAVVTKTPAPEPERRPERPAEAEVRIEDDTESERGWKESAVVIGGAAGTGAGIGALAKGKKGAAVGAAIGAATGAAYELIKRDKNK